MSNKKQSLLNSMGQQGFCNHSDIFRPIYLSLISDLPLILLKDLKIALEIPDQEAFMSNQEVNISLVLNRNNVINLVAWN